MCDGFSLSETIRLGNFVFIADFFGSLSLSPRIGHTGSTFMGSTRNEASTLQLAMIEDSTEEFLMASSREGSFGLPSPRSCSTRPSLAPVTTMPWIEDVPAAQATMMVPLCTAALRLETGLSSE
jgi:hypothetical protein